MKSTSAVFALFVLVGGAHVAWAQETPGAARWELGLFPGGGTFFTKGSTDAESSFKNYALGASAARNLNSRLGIEGEIGGGLAVQQDLDFNGIHLANLTGPSTLAYNGDVVYTVGRMHSLAPYVTGGMGGLTLRAREALQPVLGVKSSDTFLSENLGGGVKWLSSKHWGVRGDYRFFVVDGKNSGDQFFGLNDTRFGHRVYGSLLLAY
jgi:hypothetical protein